MKIILFNYEYPPAGGGGGIGSRQFAEAWAKKGHQVSVITSWHKGLAKQEIKNGVKIVRVFTLGKKDRATATVLSIFCYLFFGFWHVLFNVFHYKKFDVMNTHFSIFSGPLGYAANIMTGIPNILTIIGGDIYDPSRDISPHRSGFYRFANNVLINSADRVIAISSDTKKRALKYYKVKKPITIINYGFNPESYKKTPRSQLKLKENIFYLSTIGRLVERKGYKYLIESLSYLPEDISVIIIGDGPLEKKLKELAKKLKVSHRVVFAGFRDTQDKYNLLANSDCYVLSSLHEGMGIVVQEAMYAGLPIVSTDNGGQIDLIKEGENGLFVPIEDSKSLATAIKKLYSNKGLAKYMGSKNLKFIKTMYIDSYCEKYLSIFKEVIK